MNPARSCLENSTQIIRLQILCLLFLGHYFLLGCRKLVGSPAFCAQVFSTYHYTFDNVYDAGSQQQQVYDTTAREAVLSTLQVGDRKNCSCID